MEIDYTAKIVSAIKGHYNGQGYHADYVIVDGSKIETDEGIDAVVIVGAKMLGIQTKRIYTDSATYYRLNKKQHDLIRRRPWVYYAFPENLPRTVDGDVLLHRTIFSPGRFTFKQKVGYKEITDKMRWGEISEEIDECPAGIHIKNEKEKANLNAELRELFREFVVSFAIDFKRKHLRVSGYEHQIDKRAFRKKKDKDEKKKEDTGTSRVCPTCGRPFD